jgi:DNA repair protein RecN (Recombination protein N)
LLLGNRADTKVLFNQDEKCVIEGVFGIANYNLREFFNSNNLDYQDETIIRREIAPGGKSRAFINDTPVTLDIMRELGSDLMEIHSQHDTLKLGSNSYQLFIVDSFARTGELLQEYSNHYSKYISELGRFNVLTEEAEKIRKDADYNNFLYDELVKASLSDENEQKSLEEELSTLEHAEEIKIKLLEIIDMLDNREFAVTEILNQVSKNLDQISSYARTYEELRSRIAASLLELKDISGEAAHLVDKVESDPGRLEFVNERLNLINRLEQKHRVSDIRDLLLLQAELEGKVSKNQNLDAELEKLRAGVQKSLNQVKQAGKALSEGRKAGFPSFTEELEIMLKDLGIPEAKLEIGHTESEPGPDGMDEITLKFSANKGVPPKPFREVASGGEFSRLMFCIKKLLAQSTALPTLVLDEIDTGISGEIAIKMARMMKEMSKHHQVIAITHLPQIAAAGSFHYFVYKDSSNRKAISRIRELQDEERIREIAKMIGGDAPSPAAFDSARELLVKGS